MVKQTKIVLLTHGGWGMSLVKSLEMILGKINCVTEIALEPSHTFNEYLKLVRDHTESLSPGSLIITDLIGGTPSNVGAIIGRQTGIRVFCGLSAPMLLEACVELQGEGRIDFDAVLRAGHDACKDVVEAVLDNMR